MSSIDRPLAGGVLVFDVEREVATQGEMSKRERGARTLVKEGPMRLKLIVLGAGAEISEHRADGPISMQVVRGRVDFTAGGRERALETGIVLSAGPGVPHSVRSAEGGAFLLTVTPTA